MHIEKHRLIIIALYQRKRTKSFSKNFVEITENVVSQI